MCATNTNIFQCTILGCSTLRVTTTGAPRLSLRWCRGTPCGQKKCHFGHKILAYSSCLTLSRKGMGLPYCSWRKAERRLGKSLQPRIFVPINETICQTPYRIFQIDIQYVVGGVPAHYLLVSFLFVGCRFEYKSIFAWVCTILYPWQQLLERRVVAPSNMCFVINTFTWLRTLDAV